MLVQANKCSVFSVSPFKMGNFLPPAMTGSRRSGMICRHLRITSFQDNIYAYPMMGSALLLK